ncbi:D-aminoacyl-tRNA deacylase [Williamsia sterculiae]|uniref:D-aminoacyl-tRNA deacylase n=1 Tax=Williamsia sterculiae TaxID=1344003 RepID=A0A1N7GSJ3_9NOCA|nr:D-aminoacyl-tRNA deacylase [Williamsia sterculiae]SIS15418.1 D-tyrosyl-tRNA(Tyr) deacylase [Williamsia sterculiae]
MRAILQRVTAASVSVDGEVVGALDLGGVGPDTATQGLVALIGVTHDDTVADAAKLADKIWRLRILDGERGAADVGAPILVVSQFTLYANTAKGRRPSWNAAAPGPVAEPLVNAVVETLRAAGARVATGVFGAHMAVELVNDGPVTILIEV